MGSDKAAVDHDAQTMEPFHSCHIVLRQVLQFIARPQVLWREGLETQKHATESRLGGLLNKVALEHRCHRGSTLEHSPHAPHLRNKSPSHSH